MKKVISILAAAILSVSMTVPAFAQGAPEADIGSNATVALIPEDHENNTVQDDTDTIDTQNKNTERFPYIAKLVGHWEANGYPDYVGGTYSTDGTWERNITVLLVNDDGSMADEIRSYLVDHSGVTFGKALYSYNTLWAVNDEIYTNYMLKDRKIYSMSAGGYLTDEQLAGSALSRDEAMNRVHVSVDETVLEEYANIFHSLYGGMVVVKAGEMAIALAAIDDSVYNRFSPTSASNRNGFHLWLLTACAVFFAGATSILLVKQRRLTPALQTNNGGIVTGNGPVSKKETVDAIKKSAVTPSDTIFDSIMERVEKLDK